MLETLRIQNYALIDAVEIDFRDGFNVLTGETGAGKSILVGALNLVLGARASAEALREGSEKGTIDAAFRIRKPSARLARLLKNHEIVLEDGELLLSRTLTSDGRNRGYVCGNLVPISVLSDIGDELVDLHGQHEHQSLLKPDRQIDLLDGFGGTDSEAEAASAHFAELRAMDRELTALETDDRERARQVEFLRFEVHEIDGAELSSGEEVETRGRLNLITNAEKIFTLAAQAYGLLYENEDRTAIDLVGAALRDIEELAAVDERFRPLAAQLAEARTGAETVAAELRGYTEQLEFDPEELERLNARLTLLRDLKRKYGGSVDEILAYREKAAAQIESFDRRDERLAELREQREILAREAARFAEDLSKKRTSAAHRLDKRVTEALQDLGMKGGRFQTQIDCIDLCAQGIDRIEFLLSANPGEKLKPLRQVASGGEISRIMLALKAVFARADHIPTLIFDEIDAGVGGAVARKVAEKIQDLSRTHQVICITHIAQIAAVANAHFRVSKETRQKRTATQVSEVSATTRAEEVARLLDGSVSEVSLEHARALLSRQ